MKKIILILTCIILLLSCSNDDNFITINGSVERAINGEKIANQIVHLETIKSQGSGQYTSYITALEYKQVLTDANGNFSVTMKIVDNMFVRVFKIQDDNFSAFELKNFYPTENITVKVNKLIKFKIFVKNTNPFDNNDRIDIQFFSGFVANIRTKIENFGVPNNFTSNGSGQNIIQESSWNGINVNSIIYYKVPENSVDYKIRWFKTKNGIQSEGFSNDIPFQSSAENEYNFNY